YSHGLYRGFFRVDFSTQSFAEVARSNLWTCVGVSLLACGLIALIAGAIGRRISAPMVRIANAMQALEAGDGDLSFRLDGESDGEVGQLARHFNAFVSKLQSLMREVAENAATLSAASGELPQISDRPVGKGHTLSQGATAVAERTHEVSANVEAVASAAVEATRNVSSVSSSTEQMSQNMAQVSLAAEAVASNAVEVEGSIRDISDAMATIRGNTEKAATGSRQGAEEAPPVQQ